MQPERSFLGTGWAFPPAFSEGGAEVDMVSAAEDIHQSLQILFSTA
jgi:phage baseplate assembly protein W